jgi:hypothetical protein
VPEQVAVQVVDVDEAQTVTGNLVLPVGVLFGVGDVEQATERLNVEGRKPCRDLVVREAPR